LPGLLPSVFWDSIQMLYHQKKAFCGSPHTIQIKSLCYMPSEKPTLFLHSAYHNIKLLRNCQDTGNPWIKGGNRVQLVWKIYKHSEIHSKNLFRKKSASPICQAFCGHRRHSGKPQINWYFLKLRSMENTVET
jgi:hypothetical protein